ncbi:MAG TPA: hypothetical protein VF074_10530 [Pyrinomonadaceae bacterium]
MKSILSRFVVVLVVGALTSVVALAKVHKEKVNLVNDIKINNTLVKKGTYEIKFDDQTGQLSVSKNGKVVAQAMGRLESREKKASEFLMRSTGSGDSSQLLGVTFGGQTKDVIISNNGAQTSGSN